MVLFFLFTPSDLLFAVGSCCSDFCLLSGALISHTHPDFVFQDLFFGGFSAQASCITGETRARSGPNRGDPRLPLAWCHTSNSPLMPWTAWGWAEPPWTCCIPPSDIQVRTLLTSTAFTLVHFEGNFFCPYTHSCYTPLSSSFLRKY